MELGQMKQWAGRVVSAATVAILFLTTGCAGFFVYPGSLPGGGSGSSSGAGNDVYVINQTPNQNAGTLVGYSIGTNSLTAVTGSPQLLSFIPVAIAVNHTNTMVFVAGGNVIETFTIGSGGALSPLYTNTLTADVAAIDISPDGQWLLGIETTTIFQNEARIDEFQINSSGQLSQPSLNPVVFYTLAVDPGTIGPSAIKFAPNGQLVFLALGTAGDLVYTFTTSSGALPTTGPSQTIPVPNSSTADLAVAVTPSNSYVYFARSSGTTGSVVAAYAISGTTVAQAPVSTASAGDRPAAVVVNTTGTNVYVANELSGSGTITGYSGAASGNLTALSLSPYSVSYPTALAVDHSGAYLLAVSDTTSVNNLNMYSYDSSGNLVSSTSLNTGSLPVGLAATY
jgi:6-phosphogluconolactonase (cycloisomerase 2 family)